MVRALPEDGQRYEVVHGELLVTPAPTLPHQRVVTRLVVALAPYCERLGLGEVLTSPADVSWGEDVLVQPDVFVTARDEAGLREWSSLRTLDLVVDGLAAVEETTRTEMRPLYFHHALDELKHARMFRERATELSGARGRAQAVVEDASYIASHGIRGEQSLFQELGELATTLGDPDANARAAHAFRLALENSGLGARAGHGGRVHRLVRAILEEQGPERGSDDAGEQFHARSIRATCSGFPW